MHEQLAKQIGDVARRCRALRRWTSLTWLFAAASAGVGLLVVVKSTGLVAQPFSVMSIGLAVAAMAFVIALSARFAFRQPGRVVRIIEDRFPELDQRLLTAAAQRPDPNTGRFGYLQQTVVDESLQHAADLGWNDAVPAYRLRMARAVSFAACLLLVAALTVYAHVDAPQSPLVPASRGSVSADELHLVEVEPGDSTVERGSGVVFSARFRGPLPSAVLLIAESRGSVQSIEMQRSLDDPLFAAHLPEIDEDLSYHVEFAGQRSEAFQISVFDYPALVRADAEIQLPAYAGGEERVVLDTRRVTVPEGSQLTWQVQLNKPVSSARLVDDEGNELVLETDERERNRLVFETTLSASRRWTLKLLDDAGRANKHPARLIANVVANQPADIALSNPSDLRVSPVEELPLEADIRDDYGLARLGLTFTVIGDVPQDVELRREERFPSAASCPSVGLGSATIRAGSIAFLFLLGGGSGARR